MKELGKKERGEDSFMEGLVLKWILGFSLLAILPYFWRGYFVAHDPKEVMSSISAFLIYGCLFLWLYVPGRLRIKKHFIVNVLIVSVIAGFFVLGGLRGIIAFDLANIVFFITLICSGRLRTYYLLYIGLVIMGLSAVAIFLPHYISVPNDPVWFTVLNGLIRLLLSFTLGIALRDMMQAESKKVLQLLNEVQELNGEIVRHNEELREISEKLRQANESLEEEAEERTAVLETNNQKLLVYSYINSHVFRAPIARIKGLLLLNKWVTNEEDRQKLDGFLHSQIEEIDKITYKIADIINDNETEEFEKIAQQAEKIYTK